MGTSEHTLMLPDISHSCRLCLKDNENIRNIFHDNEWSARDMSQTIFECTNIQVTQNDGAIGVCRACLNELTSIVRFRRKCHQINEYLGSRYNGIYFNSIPQSSSARNDALNKTDFIFLDLGDEKSLIDNENTTEELCDDLISNSDQLYEEEEDSENSTSKHSNGSNVKCKYKLKGVTKYQELTNNMNWPKLKKRDLIEKKAYRGLCHICGREFQHLWVHLQFHRATPTDTCDICGKGFKSKANLQLHILMHKDAQLPCEICGKKYRTKMRLKRHLRVHTGNRPFTCHICNKKFYTKYNLEVHSRSHTGEKPFSCKYCNEKFTHSYALKPHYEKNHKDLMIT